MPPEVLAQVRAKALETRRANKARSKGLNWEEQERLRIREHIAQLNDDLKSAPTAVDKLRLAQALSKLYEVAGLPKAGAFRPTQKPERSKPSLGPLD